MKLCMLVPKSGKGATMYCHIREIFKQYANAYNKNGDKAVVKMDNYTVYDATSYKAITDMINGQEN